MIYLRVEDGFLLMLHQRKIPQELLLYNKWVMWKLEQVIDSNTKEVVIDDKTGEPKITKVPYQVNGEKASSKDSSTWSSYIRALESLNSSKYDGIGFVLTKDDPYTVIDLDNSIVDGRMNAEHGRIISSLNSYTEYSQSGTGFHIFVKAKKPGTRCKNKEKNIEIYDNSRFIVMTGDHLENSPLDIEGNQEMLSKIYNYYLPNEIARGRYTLESRTMEDQEILNKAFQAQNGAKVKRLFDGDLSIHSGDHSSADLALCSYLAFYTQNTQQIDRIFRLSKLYRKKWDEKRGSRTYSEMTIEKALSGLKTTYQSTNSNHLYLLEDNNDLDVLPKPFFEKNNSLYYQKINSNNSGTNQEIFISRQIPILEREIVNIENGNVFYELSWKHRERTKKVVVPASFVSDSTEIINLSNQGLSVNSNNRKKLIEFIDLYLLNNEINQSLAVERLGRIKDVFIHPSLTSEVEIVAADYGEEQLKEAFEVKGTADSWKSKIFNRLKNQPKAVFMVLSSFASVVIEDLGVKPFIVEVSGETSRGKTTVLEIATSVWGNKYLMNEWNATPVVIERKAAFLNSFPLLMDDSRKANRHTLELIPYLFSGGRSKGRGSIKGSQKEYSWNNIMLSTGEVSLNDYGENKGGVAARIIPLGDEPLERDYDNIVHLQEAMKSNYGAIGIEFLKAWLKHKNEMIKNFTDIKKLYVSKAGNNNVLTRLSEFYATVHFTGVLLRDYLGVDVNTEALLNLFDEIKSENKDVDKPLKFLEDILTDLDSNREQISSFYPSAHQTNAVYKKNQLYLLPAYTKEFLGVEERQTRKLWLKRGITIEKMEKGKIVDYGTVEHHGRRNRALAINMQYVEKLGFNFEQNTFESHK